MIYKLRNQLEQLKGQRDSAHKDIQKYESLLNESKSKLEAHETALHIAREVGILTQQQLEVHVSNIVSMALSSIFENEYDLKIEFIERRNKTECDIFLEKDGERLDPINDTGGGVVDVAAFALRVASWSMKNPKSRNTIILDEPFRYVSTDLQEKASAMIKEISEKLGIQFIIVSHNQSFVSSADKVFQVFLKNGKSVVK